MNKKNISAGTVARTIILLLALINQCLSMAGIPLLPIADSDVETIVTTSWTVIASLVSWWKNNSFTQAALAGDEKKDKEKAKGE